MCECEKYTGLYNCDTLVQTELNKLWSSYFWLFEETVKLWLSHTGVCSALVSRFVMIVRCFVVLCVNVKSVLTWFIRCVLVV